MRQYLIEGVTGAFPFIVDRSKAPVAESRPNGTSYTRIPGRFSVCDCVNGNNRRYRKQVWEKNLQKGSILQESISRNAAFGLLEHPKDGVVTLLSPISHHVTKAEMVESAGADGKKIHEVVGEIALLDTEDGNKLKALIEGGYNPLVSSRGYGSLAKVEGFDDVQDDYICEGWDVVIKPSFDNAELNPDRSGTTARMAEPAAPNPQAESKDWEDAKEDEALHRHDKKFAELTDEEKSAILASLRTRQRGLEKHVVRGDMDETRRPALFDYENDPGFQKRLAAEGKAIVSIQPNKITLKESSPSSTGAATPTSETKNKPNTMELNEIKARIDSLRAVDPARPKRFAESMTQVEELHQQVAEWAAADGKRAWEATKMHNTLDDISKGFTETIKAPVKEAKRLTEQNGKLMRVINAVASTAVTYKKKLGEALKADGSRVKMIEELTRRGQGWQRIAESRKQKFVVLEKDFDTSCEALDLMAQRYHEDVTELGRRLIILEFKEKAQAPEIQKSLKEASRLRHIVSIREKLEGKPAKKVNEEGGDPGGKQPKEGEAPAKAFKDDKQKDAGSPDEGKVAKEPGAVTNESKPARVLNGERVDLSVRSINESVELVRRLSGVEPAKGEPAAKK